MTPKTFAAEVSRLNTLIKKTIGVAPIGFRAPSFSLSNRTIWALRILKESGYLYDSSAFPVRTPLYGVSGIPSRPYHPSFENLSLDNRDEKLVEFPPLATSFLGIRIPAAGGFYFRILPTSIVRHAVFETNRNSQPAMVFFHPWELMERTPRLRLSPYRYIVSYLNLPRVEKQIRSLAKQFRFAPAREVLEL
jgi:polysaccharide deacetylase family protein (PEP-CTERM system associated)